MEKAVIGCIFLDPKTLPSLIDKGVSSEWFYDSVNRTLWERCVEFSKDGREVEIVAFASRYKCWDDVNECQTHVHSTANLQSWLDDLKVLFKRRVIAKAATKLQLAAAGDPASLDENLETLRILSGDLERTLSGNSLPPMKCVAQSIREKIKPPPEIIEGILHKRSKMSFGGVSKGFKTWTIMNLATCVAHGIPWLGFKTHKSRALYVNFELEEWAFSHRAEQIAASHGIEYDDQQLIGWHLRGESISYKDIMPKLEYKITDGNFGLVVLDPIYKLYGDGIDENKAGDIAKVLNAIERLAVRSQAAVVFGAHFSKGNQSGRDAIDRISGSGVFARDPDTIMTFTAHKDDDHYVVEPTLRNFRPVPGFVVRWECPQMMLAAEKDPTQFREAKGKGQTSEPKVNEETARELLDLLDHPMTTTEMESWAKKKGKICRSKFYDMKRVLHENGLIKQDAKNRWVVTQEAFFKRNGEENGKFSASPSDLEPY